MKYKPLVSIVTVCYNSENTIEDTIMSILNQTYQNIEYIVIDGGSTDDTVNIIKKYEPLFCKRGIKYLWISEKDKGIYNAMNKGIKLSSGEWIGIINSDDWYELDAVSNIAKSNNKKFQMVHGDMNIYLNNKLAFVKKSSKSLRGIKRKMIINHSTVFVRKDVYKKYGLFNENLKIASDWYFILKVYKNINIKYLENKVISNFRNEGISSFYDLSQAKEKHSIRRHLQLYRMFDIYYIYDLFKFIILGEKTLNKLLIYKNNLKIRLSRF